MDWQHAQSTDRSIHPEATDPAVTPPSGPPPHAQVNAPSARSLHTESQDLIEGQFGFKILLKHRELRLIDQEIAKCQIALEQLRRCQEIPYPAMSSSYEEMLAVSKGIGPIQSNGAESAPPWGVTDGPYTRHYRHWLIPDTAFGDRLTQEVPVAQPSRTSLDRSVRASTAGKSSLANHARSQRGQGSAKLKALPHGYPEAKEDKGPMIIKRSSDGKMVKLICPVCERLDFNSVQGFINHCRIAHSRNFQSHDAAAMACGEEVELDAAGRIVGETSTSGASTAGLVHPLITGEMSRPDLPPVTNNRSRTPVIAGSRSRLLPRSPAAANGRSRMSPQNPASGTPTSASTAFQPSPQTPYLSKLISKRGEGIDLEEQVNLAKIKYDADADLLSDDDAGGSDVESETVTAARLPSGPINHSTRGIVRPDHPPSRAIMPPSLIERSTNVKPPKSGSRRPKDLTGLASYSTNISYTNRQGSASHHGSMNPSSLDGRFHAEATSPNLSPNTAESHQAPSLISDNDDVENTHSEYSSTADVGEDLERHYFGMEFEGHDEHAMEDIEGASGGAGASHLGHGAKFKTSHHPGRSSTAMRSPDDMRNPIIDHSERHVTFASPMQRPRKKGSK
ncbi:MAG: hypothetical protein Q9168_002098 [Polycauliona sp. 1 TL-2023]